MVASGSSETSSIKLTSAGLLSFPHPPKANAPKVNNKINVEILTQFAFMGIL